MRPDLSTHECIQAARDLGFQVAGVASAERFPEAESRLVEWFRRGRHGRMAWFDEPRLRRSCRPAELLPGARSIVVVGAAYSSGGRGLPPSVGDVGFEETHGGGVARYARGRDYHDILKARLWRLVDFLRQRGGPDVRCRVFVDTGPLAEREAAVRAGLGFYGKNTCLLTAEAGSYLLLGAIVTDLPLEPTPSQPRDCGACRLCLDACPTGALRAPYELDSRLCISYLTIELRGPIPTELRPKLGNHVFGCDICQEVCPWNHGKGPVPWPEFSPDHEKTKHEGRKTEDEKEGSVVGPSSFVGLDLVELLHLDEEAFRRRFKGSPLKRARRSGLLRNAAVALGNSRDRRAVPALTRAARDDPDPVVREHAAWALEQLTCS